MKIFEVEKFSHLLTSSLVTHKVSKIVKNIKFAQHYNILDYITVNFVKKSFEQKYALINYLISNNIPVIISDKLNPIFSCSPSVLIKKYNIDLKSLVKMYDDKEEKNKILSSDKDIKTYIGEEKDEKNNVR